MISSRSNRPSFRRASAPSARGSSLRAFSANARVSTRTSAASSSHSPLKTSAHRPRYLLNLPLTADFGAVRPQTGAGYAARVRRPHTGWIRRSRLPGLAKERERSHRRHPSRPHAAPSRHQLRAGQIVARGTQLRSAAGTKRPGLLLGRARGLAQQGLRNSVARAVLRILRQTSRRRITNRTGASPAAFCSTTGAGAGFRSTGNTAAACRRRSALRVPLETAR